MTNQDAFTLIRAIRAHSGLELASIRDAATHGADSGFGGFTYYGDCSDFYDANESLIWSVLEDATDEVGADNVPALVASFGRADMATDLDGFKCLCSWAMLELAGMYLIDRAENRRSYR